MILLKNEKQIEGIRKSCHLLADMFIEVLPKIKAGMSTQELDDIIHHFIVIHGGKPAWYREDFPGAACISINEEVIHGIPSKKRFIKMGDLVSIDVGINLEGFISDSTHSIIIGKSTPQVHKLHEVTKECLQAGILACKAGNRISDIAKAISSVANREHYGIVHEYCGHGVGLDVHEEPSVYNCPSTGPNPRIQAGMVLAIEPMINLGTGDVYERDDNWTVVTKDHKVSCHEEHTVAVFKDRTEVLTALDYAKQ